MADAEFNKLLNELGYGSRSYPPNGRLNHWPSGKLFDPVDYYWIKDFAERLLDQRDTKIVRMRAGLEWIASVNAMDYEYVAKAKAVLASIETSGSDWERVGGFRFNDYGGWQQVSAEYESDPDVTILYRKRNAGVTTAQAK